MSNSSLSTRGVKYLESPPYLKVFSKYLSEEAIFNPETNPKGCISLAAAETVTFADLLTERLNQIRQSVPVTQDTFGYGRFTGHRRLCRALAAYFTEFIVGGNPNPALDPSAFVVCNGAGTAIESLVASLCDPGDYVIIPTPMYHNLVVDVEKRFSARVLHLPMKQVPLSGGDKDASSASFTFTYEIDFQRLAAEYERVERAGQGRVRAFVHCNPHNPTGMVFGREVTKRLIAWCVERSIHFVSDEIYAMSRLRVPAAAANPFVSALRICREAEAEPSSTRPPWVARCRDYVHLVYSFSKDIGLNGYRAGVTYTENSALLKALEEVSYFTSIASAVQISLAAFLEDLDFMRKMLDTSAERTTALYQRCTAFLNSRGIRTFSSTTAGMFIWLDLITLLDKVNSRNPEYTKKSMREKEDWIWQRMLDGGVCILPSYIFQPEASGWFRVCFTTTKEKYVMEGLRRILAAVEGPQSRL